MSLRIGVALFGIEEIFKLLKVRLKYTIFVRSALLGFLDSVINVLSKRAKLVAIFNVAYFCSIFIVVLIAQFLFPPPVYLDEPLAESLGFFGNDWFTIFVVIFVFNLIVSAFVVVTLPGMLFFPLSVAFLVLRAVLWGLLVYSLPSWFFLVVLPTVAVEGEAYVVAAVIGTVIGLSWVRPDWMFKDEKLSRLGALKVTLREGMHLYAVVVLLLLAAAIIETVTMMHI
jgi:hypothetical protein